MMSVTEILFLAVVLYILYRFVANFLLPVVRATRQVREQFRNMQGNDQQRGAFGQDQGGGSPFTGAADPFRANQSSGQSRQSAGQAGQTGSTAKRPAAKPPADDYIDFEEIK
jgi:lipopolysaccharide export LptBFGC system permease protein LptF